MAHTFAQRWLKNRRAKAKAGLLKQKDAADRADFMQQCVDTITAESGGSDVEALMICELLWEEGQSIFDDGIY